MSKKFNNNKDLSSFDLSLFNEEEDSDEEDIFYQINENYIQSKEICSSLINFNSKETKIIKFNPKIVYKKCLERKKLGEKYNLTYKFIKNEIKLIKKIVEGHGFKQIHSSSLLFNLMWTGGGIKSHIFKTLYPFQRVNHFPKSYEVTRKDCLYKNIEKMQQEKGFKHFYFIPTSFILPYQYHHLKTIFEKEKGIWIVKPVASSQGKGIFLINNPDQIPLGENLVVSRYIENPLLIDGYKFDIRIYVAVTSYDPLVIYIYQEGLVRFATVKYERNLENISNSFMHLTNYSLNKRNHRYIRCDDPNIEDFGNKWTMSAMLRLLKSEGKDTFTLMMSIEDIIIKSFISVESQISSACQMFVPNKSNCFEVYGFDILVDDQLKPWLLEVNLSPSLNCDAPIDLKVKSHMICDLFNLISIPCIDPSQYINKQQQINHLQSQIKKRGRPISAGYSLGNETTNSNNSRAKTAHHDTREKEYIGLTSEQIEILKKIQEENRRHGAFIRIFPTGDTFEFFSNFFQQRKTSLNKIIHQHLYPTRWAIKDFNFQENSKRIRRNNIPRSKYLSIAFHSSNKNQINGSDLHHAIQRYQLYQQRLIHYTTTNIIHPHQIVIGEPVVKSIERTLSSSSSRSSPGPPQTRKATPFNSHSLTINNKQQNEKLNEEILSRTTNNLNINYDEIRQRILFKDSNENNSINLKENQFKKSSLRVSSAPKQPYQRKSNDIYRLDAFSRPISANIQHTKRTSMSVSTSSSKKLLNDDRNNLSTDEELNRDFIEQLNELSSKQHRRQYSRVSCINNLHIESSIIEQEINVEVKNENEIHKEEKEILEKTRRIIEESQIKNEELAKQAKIFQQKLQKNQIYTTLNKYSHRPPIYPTTSNKSQQLRNNQKISSFIDQHKIK